MNLKLKTLIAIVSASLMLFLANLSGDSSVVAAVHGGGDPNCFTCCSMPCCQQAVEKNSCCCSAIPEPVNNNFPAQNNKDEGTNSTGVIAQSTLPAPALIFNEKTNMVGRTTGLARAMPPPVKLFLFNESILC